MTRVRHTKQRAVPGCKERGHVSRTQQCPVLKPLARGFSRTGFHGDLRSLHVGTCTSCFCWVKNETLLHARTRTHTHIKYHFPCTETVLISAKLSVNTVPQQASAIPCQVSAVPLQASTTSHQVSAVPHQASTTSHQVSAIRHQASAIPHQTSAIPP